MQQVKMSLMAKLCTFIFQHKQSSLKNVILEIQQHAHDWSRISEHCGIFPLFLHLPLPIFPSVIGILLYDNFHTASQPAWMTACEIKLQHMMVK